MKTKRGKQERQRRIGRRGEVVSARKSPNAQFHTTASLGLRADQAKPVGIVARPVAGPWSCAFLVLSSFPHPFQRLDELLDLEDLNSLLLGRHGLGLLFRAHFKG